MNHKTIRERVMNHSVTCRKLWEIRDSDPLYIRSENDKIWGEISEKKYVDHSRFRCYVAVKVPLPLWIQFFRRIMFQSPSFDLKKVGVNEKDTLQEAIHWTEETMYLHENVPQ